MLMQPDDAALSRQLFDLVAVRYRANPSQRAFEELHRAKPLNDDRASVSEVVFEIANAAGFLGHTLGHLVRALLVEERFVEAHHYCQRWTENEPNESEAHRLAALIACQRIDLANARSAVSALRQLDADPGLLLALETLVAIVFFNGRGAEAAAHAALLAAPDDEFVLMTARDAGCRLRNARLLVECFQRDPDLSDTGGRDALIHGILRERVIELLRGRAEP